MQATILAISSSPGIRDASELSPSAAAALFSVEEAPASGDFAAVLALFCSSDELFSEEFSTGSAFLEPDLVLLDLDLRDLVLRGLSAA